ncbi:hypothetical protein [Flaviaesturariibacter flavus]|uniref:hypothetical protein n=1 Tax=Flaviaesturariibacter flavus TaxID=2502780 RepID=UPI001A9E9A97|nr:hypothetical protein [Flaviaesturariibacter flavus]
MRTTDALLGGLAGSALLTATHETLRRTVPKAPRMDLLGMEAIRKLLAKGHPNQPGTARLFWITMAGDLLTNALYYSLGGVKAKHPVVRGTILGIAAGIGGVLLPQPLGLNEQHSMRTAATALMTIGIYTLGGLAAGLVLRLLQKKREPKHPNAELVL